MMATYWYRVTLQDVRGVACSKEGDVNGNNMLHAMSAIEKLNKDKWKGLLMSVSLFDMCMETGAIATDATISWSRHGHGRGRIINMDPEWKKPDVSIEDDIPFRPPLNKATSHTVSFMAHELGKAPSVSVTHFQSTDLKEL